MKSTIFISSVQKELQDERQVGADPKCATNAPIAPAAGQRSRGRPKSLHRRKSSIMTQMPQRGAGSAKSPDEKPSRDMGHLWDKRDIAGS